MDVTTEGEVSTSDALGLSLSLSLSSQLPGHEDIPAATAEFLMAGSWDLPAKTGVSSDFPEIF